MHSTLAWMRLDFAATILPNPADLLHRLGSKLLYKHNAQVRSGILANRF